MNQSPWKDFKFIPLPESEMDETSTISISRSRSRSNGGVTIEEADDDDDDDRAFKGLLKRKPQQRNYNSRNISTNDFEELDDDENVIEMFARNI
jgi:hypothetical protein